MKAEKEILDGARQDTYKYSVDSLAVCYIEHSLKQGKAIEIPSLDIVIKESNMTEDHCKPKE